METFGRRPQRRVKVAILDSGIDYHHMHFRDKTSRDRIIDRQSWVDDQPESDSCGHGTHIAGTILSLVLNTDLYIGKITNSNTFDNVDAIVKVTS